MLFEHSLGWNETKMSKHKINEGGKKGEEELDDHTKYSTCWGDLWDVRRALTTMSYKESSGEGPYLVRRRRPGYEVRPDSFLQRTKVLFWQRADMFCWLMEHSSNRKVVWSYRVSGKKKKINHKNGFNKEWGLHHLGSSRKGLNTGEETVTSNRERLVVSKVLFNLSILT